MTNPPPLVPRHGRPGHSRLSPVAFSVLVSPGAGQFMQRRWVAGILFLLAATVALGWFAWTAFVVLKAYYGLAFDPMHAPAEIPGPAGLMCPFVAWLVIYVAGIVDTAIAIRGKG